MRLFAILSVRAHGRPRLRPWRHVCIAQVVKRYAQRRVVDVERRIVDGTPAPPRSPNGAACPSPKPRRASRRRLAASAGCARRPPLGVGELGETSVGGAGATGWGGASGGTGRSRAAVPPALAARPPSWPGPAARAGGLPAPARAGPPRAWALPGTPGQGLRQAGRVGRAGRPQAWAPTGAGWQEVGARGWVELREKWLYFSYTRYSTTTEHRLTAF